MFRLVFLIMTKAILVGLLLPAIAFANDPQALTLQNKNTKASIKIEILESMQVSDNCYTNKTDCLTRIDRMFTKPFSSPLRGNPASQYCVENGGNELTLNDAKGNEYSFCDIGNHYLVDSWGIFRRNTIANIAPGK